MEITKTIVMDEEMAACIQKLADSERRSFSREAQVLLETALGSQKKPVAGAEA
jgi:hypothetical protein